MGFMCSSVTELFPVRSHFERSLAAKEATS